MNPDPHRSGGFVMNSISSIALSGMHAAQVSLQSSANNVANLSTPNFRREEVLQSSQAGGGVAVSRQQASVEGASLEADVVSQLQAKNAFLANLAVFKTSNQMAGALLDKTV
jgi:flagellar basal body rod protein FlgG